MILLGVDPGFSALGYFGAALVDGRLVPVMLGVIETEKSDAKRKVGAPDDNFRRCREIVRELLARLEPDHVNGRLAAGFHKRLTPPVLGEERRVLCVESMSIPRIKGQMMVSAAVKTAMAWGVLATLSELYRWPVVQESPQTVKKRVAGRVDASKETVEEAVRAKLGLKGFDLRGFGCPKALHEHVWDAAAALLACEQSEVARAALG